MGNHWSGSIIFEVSCFQAELQIGDLTFQLGFLGLFSLKISGIMAFWEKNALMLRLLKSGQNYGFIGKTSKIMSQNFPLTSLFTNLCSDYLEFFFSISTGGPMVYIDSPCRGLYGNNYVIFNNHLKFWVVSILLKFTTIDTGLKMRLPARRCVFFFMTKSVFGDQYWNLAKMKTDPWSFLFSIRFFFPKMFSLRVQVVKFLWVFVWV